MSKKGSDPLVIVKKQSEYGSVGKGQTPFWTKPSLAYPTVFRFACLLAYANALFLVVPDEWTRFQERGFSGWWTDINPDTTPYLLLLAIAPVCWSMRWSASSQQQGRWHRWLDNATELLRRVCRRIQRPHWYLAAIVAGTSWFMSHWVSHQPIQDRPRLTFTNSPPLIHDEYSYRIMAKTFLAGRTWFPSHPDVPELFDQLHVLNDGKFASRYFPGVGLWMAPFVAVGAPHWGHWLAGSLAATFIFFAGRELGGNAIGFLAGLLTALSPGMAIFSNLLLAHHPCLGGLTLFLWMFLRMMRTRAGSSALIAGIALTFAMLCRPLTAAGFALPFGLWILWRLARPTVDSNSIRLRVSLAAALGVPIFAGLAIQFAYNHSITGNGWLTPYQLYTEIYTPRHVYGFNNVARGEQNIGPKVNDDYDRWAKNLTPELALENVENRFTASLQWSLGTIPIFMALIVFVFLVAFHDRRWCLLLAAIFSLHAMHVPYWWDGIMNWHYVFETGPLWLLVFAGATQFLTHGWHSENRCLMPALWCGLVVISLSTAYTSIAPLWKESRLEAGLRHFQRKAENYRVFREAVDDVATERPALILVDATGQTFMNYVDNDPGLNAEILYGRIHGGNIGNHTVQEAFPNRAVYLYQAGQSRLVKIETADESGTPPRGLSPWSDD